MSKNRTRRQRSITRMVNHPPGTLLADPSAPKPTMRVMSFGPEELDELTPASVEEIRPLIGRRRVLWIDVDGLGDAETIRQLGAIAGMHPLAMEDVLDATQRPKLDAYGDRFLVTLRVATIGRPVAMHQLSVFAAPGVVLTFHERNSPVFDELRNRIRAGRGRVRQSSSSYLAYAAIDAAIDGYFPVLEAFGDRLETLEHAILTSPDSALVGELMSIRRELLSVRRAVWPMRDIASALAHESELLEPEVRLYARDAHDHASRILDLVESFRELGSSMVDIHIATNSNRMNEVIKVLTIISTIFIPLSFIAGVYGMNFDPEVSRWNMPELAWPYGYFFALAVMALTAGGLLTMFWWRGWFSRQSTGVADLMDEARAKEPPPSTPK